MMLSSAVALALCAISPSFGVLLVMITVLGADDRVRADPHSARRRPGRSDEPGRVVGTVVSGILTGILASRTISGLVAGAAGWRAIYVLAAGAAIAFALLLYRAIPPLARRRAWRIRHSSPPSSR
jgi:predicted MFS family arabinose efflux permease